jgi:hypothetical protein
MTRFEDMNPLQKRLHNAAIALELDGDEFGFSGLMRETIEALQEAKMSLIGRDIDGKLIPARAFFQA